MQIRLTVVDPLGPSSSAAGRAASCDVLVTAPAGTALAAVASALAAAVTGDASGSERGRERGAAERDRERGASERGRERGTAERGREPGAGPVVLYAGAERLDAQRCTLGEPPLLDGAVLSLGAPADPEPHPELDEAPTQLHVVAGPDAGGVHLLHGGQITVGRSADADVPLDDPDVSRVHCAVTVGSDGRVSVADLGSTNGTVLDGRPVGTRPVLFAPGALLRIGESALRLTPAAGPGARARTAPDGEGHVRVPSTGGHGPDAPAATTGGASAPAAPARVTGGGPGADGGRGAEGARGTGGRWGADGSSGADGGRGTGGEWHTDPTRGPGDGRGAGSGHGAGGRWGADGRPGADGGPGVGGGTGPAGRPAPGPEGRQRLAYGSAGWGASGDAAPGAREHGSAEPPVFPAQSHAPGFENRGRAWGPDARGAGPAAPGDTHGGPLGATGHAGAPFAAGATGSTGEPAGLAEPAGSAGPAGPAGPARSGDPGPHGPHGAGATAAAGGALGAPGAQGTRAPSGITHDAYGSSEIHGYGGGAAAPDGRTDGDAGPGGRKGTPLRGTDVPQGVRRRGGLGAWARRLAGGRGEQAPDRAAAYDAEPAPEMTASSTSPAPTGPRMPATWPDPAALLLTALGPGRRLWERGPGHPEALTVRLGTTDRAALDGSGLLPAVPVTAGLREVGALGLAGPRARLSGLARAVLAQLATLHSPDTLEIVLLSTDRARSLEERTAEWSWLGWLPHVRPGHGQDCRLLLAYDEEQAEARTGELLRRLEDHLADTRGTVPDPVPTAPGTAPGAAGRGAPLAGQGGAADGGARNAVRRPSWARTDDAADERGFAGPYTVVVVDGDPAAAATREALARLAQEGPRAGIHLMCLAETAPASPASPVTETYDAACALSPVFRACGAVALLSGDVATALRLMRVAAHAPVPPGTRAGRPVFGGPTGHPAATADTAPTGRPRATTEATPATATPPAPAPAPGHPYPAPDTTADTASITPTPIPPGTVAVVDAVSLAWAERFARALAPLRTDGTTGDRPARVSAPLPLSARLLDELGLARATPASLLARWADAADDGAALGGRARAVLGAGPRGPVCADLVADGPHLLIEGPAGSGRTELLRSVVASLAAAERPDRLGIVLVDGRDGTGAGGGHGDGLRVCTDVPHVTTHLTANDPVRMREFAQSLSAELKRRAELLGRADFAEWHTGRAVSGRIVAQRTAPGRGAPTGPGAADLDSPPSATLRLRPSAAAARAEAAPPLPRLVVVVDDLDALLSPALGSPGRPAAGSVIRALEAVAREGERLGVHLVAAAAPDGRTAESEPARRATLRVTLDAPATGPEEPAPGRGRLTAEDGRVTPFQGGRVTGRIPRTATQRPTVVALEWHRMGDPPARRSVRELGNGPTDLALLASALERAAREVSAAEVPSLL
ncbi:FHA domain-containing protein [Streptomyces sp. NPDC005526]|uniref:FHA domain-containing protein n=1 Tax=Streptomyces sp. NPDC005526 TaxID=3156885 RepID=UPI0033A4ADC1